MNKEQQLEQVVQAIKEFDVPKSPPVFELYSALVSISIAILLFLLEGVFVQNDTVFYKLMLAVSPQIGWAIAFLFGGLLSSLGMLIDNNIVRIVALLMMTATFGVVASFYIVTFPNLSGILMFWTTLFTAASIPLVRFTSIRGTNRK